MRAVGIRAARASDHAVDSAHVPTGRRSRIASLAAKSCILPLVMDEGQFWEVIGVAGGSADERALHQVWLRLRYMEPDQILGFEDRLAEVLHRMDHRAIAKQRWRDVSEPWWMPRIPGISSDGFLYARCDAVLHGPDVVTEVIADPSRFKRRWDVSAERLLFVAQEAWEARTGRQWDYDRESACSYETGSNQSGGWPS